MTRYRITIDGRVYDVEVDDPRARPVTARLGGTTYTVQIDPAGRASAAAAPEAETPDAGGTAHGAADRDLGGTAAAPDAAAASDTAADQAAAGTATQTSATTSAGAPAPSEAAADQSGAPAPSEAAADQTGALADRAGAPGDRNGEPAVDTTPRTLSAPIPGVVARVTAAVGRSVERGSELLTIEAMKMFNVIRSPWPGTVTTIHVKDGDRIVQGQPIVTLTPR